LPDHDAAECTDHALLETFLARLWRLPHGYSEGWFRGRRFRVMLNVSADRRRWKLFAEELGGPDRVSFNLYVLSVGAPVLKPCEMPARSVIDFVAGYAPDRNARAGRGRPEDWQC